MSQEEAVARFRGSLLLPFYTNDANRNNETMNDIQRRAIGLDDNVWLPLLNTDHARFEMVSPGIHLWWIAHSWVDLFSNEEEDIIEYLVVDTVRRAVEITRAMMEDSELSVTQITNRLNRFDHNDERYLSDWNRSRDFTQYVSSMIEFFMAHVPCDREVAVARFRSMIIQCFSDIEGSHYRRGRELRRDGLRLQSRWWSAFLPMEHPQYRNVFPSSSLFLIEEQEFSAIPREDIYDDVESYRAGRRAIAIARGLLEEEESVPITPQEEVEQVQAAVTTTTTTITPSTPTSFLFTPPTPETPTRTTSTFPAGAALRWDESVETGKEKDVSMSATLSLRILVSMRRVSFPLSYFSLQKEKEVELGSLGEKRQSLKNQEHRIALLQQQQQQQKLLRNLLALQLHLLCLPSSKTNSSTLAETSPVKKKKKLFP